MKLDEQIIERIRNLRAKGSDLTKFGQASVGRFVGWQAQVQTFLIETLGNNHNYTQRFFEVVKFASVRNVEMGLSILDSLEEDIRDGYLFDIKNLVSAEVFDDFLEMAEHLLENKYKDPAASLSGAVLENCLKEIAENSNIKLKKRENLNSLNQKCADAELYNRIIQKKIQSWIEIRNYADHGEFSEYSKDDVKDMLRGIRQFIGEHLK
ncbi:HEPN domain-containing protein [candidate division WOR-3 bacterium]|nr:HEPN domain-containing protein [candidate division WOR-3 bacterium]